MKDPAFFPCAEWENKLAATHPDDLLPAEREALKTHIVSCPRCAAVLAVYQEMDELISSALLPACPLELPEGIFAPRKELSVVRGLQKGDRSDTSSPSRSSNALLGKSIAQEEALQFWNDCESQEPMTTMQDTTGLPALAAQYPLKGSAIRAIEGSWTDATYTIGVFAKGQMDKYTEMTLEDLESAELAVEDLVSQVLLDLFGEIAIDEVCISSSPNAGMNHSCSLQIRASSSSGSLLLDPQELLRMELTVEDAVSCILVQLFGMVIVDEVQVLPATQLLEALD